MLDPKWTTNHEHNLYVGRSFVQVRYWESGCLSFNGPHKWNIHLFVHISDLRFPALVKSWKESGYVDGNLLPFFHGGVTFTDSAHNDQFLKIGCDYAHSGDEEYSHTPPEQWERFIPDCQPLIDYLLEAV